ncbi:MAG: Kynurenine formamidase [Nitrospirae bacterium]|nr:MAG: putative cyclase [Nitrospira sp. OLB3]MBV6469092.1 Kynurenine formamidase [Nitrospirota bacterium]MCE7965940.1 cyclase family protein [Nitrospira sp. NTP2]MCK6493294.1 cyclase family protein [Nitrospira sp.]MEB2338474.1 cyclase family protein [Nitrospirales bacterium]
MTDDPVNSAVRQAVLAAGVFLFCLPGLGAWCEASAGQRLVDLTYAFDETTQVWPTNPPFHRSGMTKGGTETEAWYATGQVALSEHAGTHMDAPIHFAQGQVEIDRIPVEQLMGLAAVIDVREATALDRDYRVSTADLQRWEAHHGPLPNGAIVLMLTGWGTYWKDRTRYFGSATPDHLTTLHFPGISQEAAEWLVAKRVSGVGIDTPSMDHGPSQDFVVHRILSAAGVYGLENVARLDELPPVGATVVALPMKIAGGTGAPVRIIAIVP